MATRKALVIGSSGRAQQLQSGDTLAGGSEVSQFLVRGPNTAVPGTPVYVISLGTVALAKADAAATGAVVALAVDTLDPTADERIQSNGVLTLTTGQWDAVCGTSGGLTAGTTYFLSAATAGLLTATPPTTPGSFVVIIGVALSTTELDIRIRQPILI